MLGAGLPGATPGGKETCILGRLLVRQSEGRFLTVACQVADDGRFRPITIWTSSAAEIAVYWKDKEDDE